MNRESSATRAPTIFHETMMMICSVHDVLVENVLCSFGRRFYSLNYWCVHSLELSSWQDTSCCQTTVSKSAEFLHKRLRMWQDICAGLRSVTITEMILNQWASEGNITPVWMELEWLMLHSPAHKWGNDGGALHDRERGKDSWKQWICWNFLSTPQPQNIQFLHLIQQIMFGSKCVCIFVSVLTQHAPPPPLSCFVLFLVSFHSVEPSCKFPPSELIGRGWHNHGRGFNGCRGLLWLFLVSCYHDHHQTVAFMPPSNVCLTCVVDPSTCWHLQNKLLCGDNVSSGLFSFPFFPCLTANIREQRVVSLLFSLPSHFPNML